MNTSAIKPAKFLLPEEKINMKKWAVVACDQFTSDYDYWENVRRFVGNAPSTLNMILPEIYLNEPDCAERIALAKETMEQYVSEGVLEETPEGFMLIERQIGGAVRKGVLAAIDLEEYSFKEEEKPAVRATEKTILERIPPRVAIREDALLELPHVLILIDDPEDNVIGSLLRKKAELTAMYDFDLMENGGHITGYFTDDERIKKNVLDAVNKLNVKDNMRFCVGDGNHSLATAKTVWENAKAEMTEEEKEVSPLRYALAEIVNLRDDGLTMMPIHRALMNVSPASCIQRVCDILNEKGLGAKLMYTRHSKNLKPDGGEYTIYVKTKQTMGKIEITKPAHLLAAGDVEPALMQYLEENPSAQIEYLHGDSQFNSFADMYDTVCFYMPPINKEDFFDTVIKCGVLPKKTFSLGEANEKRYYIEGRLLRQIEAQSEEDQEKTKE